ncbi:MAG: BON domain-containing protein [Candidatus Obscuribacterales bacterium]|nr:BON domain-containing protein [Steroidobacteraceae bacterium]
MYTKSRNFLLASGIALALATSGAIAADTVSQEVTDARQETQIWTTYALSPHLRANDLKVSVQNGKATLSGTVAEGVNKDLAKQIALGVNGIKEVDNNIVVKSDYNPPARNANANRSYGETTDDATITAAVKSKLLWSRYADGLTTDVDTKMGKVTLKGTADSAAEKDLAKRLALNTRGVVSVDNQLVVDSAKATAARNAKMAENRTAENRTADKDDGNKVADSWITTKVKSTYGFSSNVDGSDITVNTNQGIVTLTGKVDSGVERALAIELAKNIKGVKSVQSKGLTLGGS